MSTNIKTPKKLIEVALPLDDINVAAAREKSIRHGHPSTLHLWWARRPLAAARAVIFAQMVNDPGYQQGGGFKYGVNKEQAAIEREKLFDIIRDLVKWKNTNNEEVLKRAREEIKKSWREICELNKDYPQAAELFDPNKLPAFHDPFAGGGSIPLEAQRLGLESYASDLNPVAVVINKAMIEIPPKFAGQKPIGPIPAGDKQINLENEWPGATGLAEDVRRYGYWMRGEAEKRIGHLYPKIKLTPEMVKGRPDLKQYQGQELTVIAWLWARTVKSPNPAFNHVDVPLASSFILSSKKGKEAYVQPVIEGGQYRFEVHVGVPPEGAKSGQKIGKRGNFQCLMSGVPITNKYIREFGMKDGFGSRLMAVVCEGKKGRCYIAPDIAQEKSADSCLPEWIPTQEMPNSPRYIAPPLYGLPRYADIFTNRQLVALTTFSDLVQEARIKAVTDAKAAGMSDDGVGIDAGGIGATAYGDAMAVYLGLGIGRLSNRHSTICFWDTKGENVQQVFARQAIPMTWDFVEGNPFSNSTGNFLGQLKYLCAVIERGLPANKTASVQQFDAQNQKISTQKVVSTDPPYYDNIGYADLSDYFYIWLRQSLKSIYPSLFGTMASPKAEELVATPYRHDSKDAAEAFFMEGMVQAIHNLSEQAHPAFPVSIYYAFKQSDTKDAGTSSTGWETFLEAVIQAGFSIVGTWPMRTEYTGNLKKTVNALASSIVLICQKRPAQSDSISRRQFQRQLRDEMPEALEAMIGGSEGASPIAPVDLAQAAIGPGMGIFSQYEAVLNQDGSKMSVHDALILINRGITDYLNPDTGSFDNDTLFCDSWFAEYGWSTGEFGQANVLAQAKGTTVDGVRDAGVIESGGGKVRLLKWQDYPTDWDPKEDNRTPVWEALHHLIRSLNQRGESGAGELLARMPERGESIRQLAYHLYTLCERKGWAEDARAYNELITAWHAIVAASHDVGHVGEQTGLKF